MLTKENSGAFARPKNGSPALLVGNTPVLWVGDPLGAAGTRVLGQARGQQPRRDEGPARAAHGRAGARARRPAARRARSSSRPAAPSASGWRWPGIVHGHPVTLVTDPGMEPIMRPAARRPTAPRSRSSTEPHPTGGWQQARRDRVRRAARRAPGRLVPRPVQQPRQRRRLRAAGRRTGRPARPDRRAGVLRWAPAGTPPGSSRALRRCYPDLRLVGVDTIGSTIFGQPAGPRLMRGLGSSIYPRNVDYAAFDEVHWVAPGRSGVGLPRGSPRRSYATGGWSVGAVALVAGWLARTAPPAPGSRRSSRTARSATSTPSTTTTTAPTTVCSTSPRRASPDDDRPSGGARACCAWTRCATVRGSRETPDERASLSQFRVLRPAGADCCWSTSSPSTSASTC